jgi:hypothetical protein
MFLFSVSLLSAGALAYQVLLMRLLSVVLWHHFAATVISLALLGYGVSGALLTLAQGRLVARFPGVYRACCALFGALAPATFALAQRIPFEPMAAVWEPRQWAYFGAMYLVLCIPFFCAASAIGLALRTRSAEISRIYRADLLGAAAGALGVLGLLAVVPPGQGLRVVGAAGFLAATAAGLGERPRRGVAALAVGGLALCLAWPASWIDPRFSSYKGLVQTLHVPGARVEFESWGPLGHLAAVSSPQVPFRHAPGLSLGCPWEVPEQMGLFRDGSLAGAVDRAASGEGGGGTYQDCLPSALPYALLFRPRVLVLGAGGGSEVRGALGHQAAAVDAVDLDGRVAALLGGPLAGFSGGLPDAPGVRFHTAEARAFAAASRESYDLVQVSLLDAFGASLAGVQAAAESYLYTVESFGVFLDRLTPGGVLAVTRWLEVPPRTSLKLFATAMAALERRGVERPGEHLALVRSWNTATLLVRPRPFAPAEVEAVRAFCLERGFDLAWLPGMEPGEANRFQVWEEAYLHDGAREILGPGRKDFFRRYKFAVEPATDERPYFFRTLKWTSLPELVAARGRGGGALVEWAYLLVPAAFLQAVAAGALFILLPLGRLRRDRDGGNPGAGTGLYFAFLGTAFLLVEVATIHRLTLLLGHPVHAAAGVLAVFLAAAGLGSQASARLVRGRRPGQAIGWAAGAAGGLALGYHLALPAWMPVLAGLPLPVRAAAALACAAPLAFFMGMPFPLGLGALARRAPSWVPWAWGVNGFASVASAALASLLGIHLGFRGVVVLAALLYAGAAWTARRW